MYNRFPVPPPQKTTTMKKPATAKTAKVNGKEISRPPPHPCRKRKPKDNLGDVPALFGLMGPGFRIPGRPVPRIRPSAEHDRKLRQ